MVAAWSAYKSRRSRRKSEAAEVAAKEQADIATKAAQDAAAAATRSADAAERSATAHETQAQLMQDEADAAERSPWRTEHHGGMDYRLRNRTNTPKYDVAVTGQSAGRPPGVFRPWGCGWLSGRGWAVIPRAVKCFPSKEISSLVHTARITCNASSNSSRRSS